MTGMPFWPIALFLQIRYHHTVFVRQYYILLTFSIFKINCINWTYTMYHFPGIQCWLRWSQANDHRCRPLLGHQLQGHERHLQAQSPLRCLPRQPRTSWAQTGWHHEHPGSWRESHILPEHRLEGNIVGNLLVHVFILFFIFYLSFNRDFELLKGAGYFLLGLTHQDSPFGILSDSMTRE